MTGWVIGGEAPTAPTEQDAYIELWQAGDILAMPLGPGEARGAGAGRRCYKRSWHGATRSCVAPALHPG